MNEYLLDLIDEHNQAKEDLRDMSDFIHYQKLDKDYCHFRKHATMSKNILQLWPKSACKKQLWQTERKKFTNRSQ